jgi:hypothetical protein
VSSKPGISIHGDGNAIGNNNRSLVDQAEDRNGLLKP